MIRCEEAAKLFQDYVDKELTAEDVQHLEEHLKLCQDCIGHVDFDRSLKALLKNRAFQDKLSAGIKSLIRDKLNE